MTIALEVDADIQVTYNPGAFITAAEAEELISAMVSEAITEIVGSVGTTIIKDITIPAAGWALDPDLDGSGEAGEDSYRYRVEVAMAEATADHFPDVALHKSALHTANEVGFCPTAQSLAGVLRLWAKKEPAADMAATVALLSSGSGGSSGGGGAYVLPVATKTRLGGVKIGDNISVTADGTISATGASVSEEDMASTVETGEMLDEVFPPEP